MKKLFFLFVCGFLMQACSGGGDDEDLTTPTTPTTPTQLPINIGVNIATRANDTAFEANDKVGIYVVNYQNDSPGTLAASGNHATNEAFTYSGSSWSSTTQLYWQNQTTKADFYGYYPYASNVSSVSAYNISVKANQTAEADYKASDILWGKKEAVSPTSSAVQLTMSHVMSNIIIYLKAGKGYTDSDLSNASVVITGLKTAATLNMATGVVTATGAAQNITPKAEDGYLRALIVPQSVSNAALIKVTVGDYSYTLTQTVTFESNKQIKCTLTVDKIEEGLNIGISGWETSDIDYGGTVK
jgi:hypothetical protein